MAKIQSTQNYDIFKRHENNREIDSGNLRRIMASIQSQNMLEFRPILVDSGMRVIDGQHRLEAAKKLGVEVYYQINEESTHQDIALLNAAQKRWTTNDYMNYYSSLGKTAYKKLLEYTKEKNVSVSFLTKLLRGDQDGALRKLKAGTLTMEDISMEEVEVQITLVNNAITLIKRYVLKTGYWMDSHKFKTALLTFFKNPEVEFQVFERKVTLKADSIHPCADVYGYYTMIRDIYNWKNANPIGSRPPVEMKELEIAG